ncbi:alpha/beta hydrolase [Saccharothrix longispora]|uniref:alpha/beta fold hydrolase n=1 Tax=Saccharothrix longispora TaxID=33920 RepID=UPI0028FD9DB4|nr:alpha/beta hydrolase [Saccharothrix longispora]MDU0287639.1 alpha/beta hydrolase [Saccharothrix longispora]
MDDVAGTADPRYKPWSNYRPENPENPASTIRTALFCHAAGFTGLIWRSCVEKLRTPLRAIAPDLRGHGSAPPLAEGADWGVFADDVLAAARDLGSGPLIGVGHSLGGTALLLAEARAPGTFDLLVCFEPVLATRHDPAFAEAAARRRAVFPSRADVLARYSARPPLSRLAPEVLVDYVDSGLAAEPDGRVRLRCAPAVEAHLFRTAVSCPWREALPRVACPTFLLRGSESTVVAGEPLRAACADLPDGRSREVPGLDHLGPLVDPGAFAAVLDGIFAESGLFRTAPRVT